MSVTLISDKQKDVMYELVVYFKKDPSFPHTYYGKDVGFPEANPGLLFVFKEKEDEIPVHIIALPELLYMDMNRVEYGS